MCYTKQFRLYLWVIKAHSPVKQGSDGNQIFPLGVREKVWQGPRNPKTTKPHLLHQCLPSAQDLQSGVPDISYTPTPSWVSVHTRGLPRKAGVPAEGWIPSLPVGKSSSSATEKSPWQVVGKESAGGSPWHFRNPFSPLFVLPDLCHSFPGRLHSRVWGAPGMWVGVIWQSPLEP